MTITPLRDLEDVLDLYGSAIDPHLPPYNAKGDAIRGRDGTTDGTNRLSVPNYIFKTSDVGKTIWVDVAGSARTIIAIGGAGDPNACTVSGGVLGAGSSRAYLFGTDDTAALQAALDAASYPLRGGYVGAATQSLRADVRGRVVKLRSGYSYLVSNSQASFDGGKTAALFLRRRTGLCGESLYAQSEIVLAPGSVGDAVSNELARAALANNASAAYVDFCTVGNLSLHGMRGMGLSPNAKSGLMFYPAYNGYLDTDPCNGAFNIWSSGFTEHGFYFGGRGEMICWGLRGADNLNYGLYLNGLVDSSISHSSFGGNRKTGVRVNRSANCRLTDIKAWYSGISGGIDEKDCANFVFEADQAANGKVLAVNLDAQESRGSGFVIDNSGHNVIKGRCQDPGQQNGLNGATLPTVRAGVVLKSAGCVENDLDIRVEAGVRAFNAPNFTGSNAIYVDASAANNFGRVNAQLDLVYTGRSGVTDGAKLGGAGVSNGSNARLKVDDVALT
jgi:hypothetical protein